jgi:hypothetical protein
MNFCNQRLDGVEFRNCSLAKARERDMSALAQN